VLDNLDYAINKLSDMANQHKISLVVNGLDSSHSDKGIDLLDNMPKIDLSKDIDESYLYFKERFPKIEVSKNNDISDRAGFLEEKKIFKNKKAVGVKVIGCKDSRIDEWLHINSNGDMFLCCDDFRFDTIFGNALDTDISELWNSDERRAMISKASTTLCAGCASAIWDN